VATSTSSRIRRSTLAVASAAATIGTGLAAAPANAAPAVPPPAVGATLSAVGGTVNSSGVLTTSISSSGSAVVNVAYTATPGNPTPGGAGDGLTTVTLNCGQPGLPMQNLLAAPATGGASGTAACDFTTTGLFHVTVTTTDNQTPGLTSSAFRLVSVQAPATVAVDRFDGGSRYGTGVAVSQAAFPTPASAGAVILARGDVFADALAGIPLAKAKNGPLLLTPGGAAATALDPNVEAELVRVLPKDKSHTVYVLGGTSAIPQVIEDYIGNTLGYNVVRLAGNSRFDTALAVAEDPRALNNPSRVVVARGDDFADALAAGPYAANHFKDANGTPAAIVLSSGPAASASLDPATAAYISSKFPESTVAGVNIMAIGGGASAAMEKLTGSLASMPFGGLVGSDRYMTAAIVATDGWGVNGQGCMAAVQGVATGLSFPDSLTGGAYMALKNGPLLLTDRSVLSASPAAVVAGGPNLLMDVTVFGGTSVVDPQVVDGIAKAVQPKPIAYTDHHVIF
jgi:hypothetical protein